MTACIGWEGDTECPLHGQFHGCRKDAPHGNTPHICACGDWRRSWRSEPDDQTKTKDVA